MTVPLFLHEALTEVGELPLQPLPMGVYEAYRLICNSSPYGLTIIRVERRDNPEVADLAQGSVPRKLNAAEVLIEEMGESSNGILTDS